MLPEIFSHQEDIKDSETKENELEKRLLKRGYKLHAGNQNTSAFHQSILDLYFTG